MEGEDVGRGSVERTRRFPALMPESRSTSGREDLAQRKTPPMPAQQSAPSQKAIGSHVRVPPSHPLHHTRHVCGLFVKGASSLILSPFVRAELDKQHDMAV